MSSITLPKPKKTSLPKPKKKRKQEQVSSFGSEGRSRKKARKGSDKRCPYCEGRFNAVGQLALKKHMATCRKKQEALRQPTKDSKRPEGLSEVLKNTNLLELKHGQKYQRGDGRWVLTTMGGVFIKDFSTEAELDASWRVFHRSQRRKPPPLLKVCVPIANEVLLPLPGPERIW